MDGDGWRDGDLMVMEGVTAPRWRWTARNGARATLMDCDCNGNGWRTTARWQLDGDGRCSAMTMNGTMATQKQWASMDGATAT